MAPTDGRLGGAPHWDEDLGAPPADLTAVVARGVLWKGLTRVVTSVTKLVVLVVLVRLLSPREYGIAGMAMVVASFVMIFTDPALAAAIVQRPRLDERDRSTVFWLATGLGAILMLAGMASAGLVADFFDEPQVESLFAASSVCFFVAALAVAHRGLLQRKLAYRSLEIREMVAVVTGGGVAIVIAFAGFGPWAIVANFIAYTVASTVLLWIMLDWRPRLVFSSVSARNLGSFSFLVFLATLLSWGNQNVDRALVGRVLGAPALGAYSLAQSTMNMPTALLGQPLHQVVSPAYARIQAEPARLQRAWLTSKTVSVGAVLPALLGLAVLAPDFVQAVFGAKWDDAVLPLRLLCLGGVANSLMALNWSVLQATGEARVLVRVMVLSSLVTWSAFALGLSWGIVGVAAMYALARWVLVVPATALTTRALGFKLRPAIRAGLRTLPLAMAAALAGLLVRLSLVEAGLPAWARLVAAGAAIALTYGLLVLLVAPSLVAHLARALRRGADERLVS
ncbi:MAG TPA: lipopolysaccharide biosynthesis protein [Gaiellaceae bacterium]|nr:lipopolysaccharide biosynthesis protein [Gaiellaceae bacterium]